MKAQGARDDLIMKVIEEFPEERGLWLVSRHSTAVQAFMRIIKDHLRALPKKGV
jgi:hypothetical protein